MISLEQRTCLLRLENWVGKTALELNNQISTMVAAPPCRVTFRTPGMLYASLTDLRSDKAYY
jgi:hypothetical protein